MGQVSKMGEVKKAMPYVQALKRRLQIEDSSKVLERKLPFDEHIRALRELNNDFTKLSKLATLSHHNTKSREVSTVVNVNHQDMLRCKLIRGAAAKVYAALVRACTKHSEHLALFCMIPICEQTNITNEDQIRFHIAFSRSPLAGTLKERAASELDEPLWFMIDSFSTEHGSAHSTTLLNKRYVDIPAMIFNLWKSAHPGRGNLPPSSKYEREKLSSNGLFFCQ